VVHLAIIIGIYRDRAQSLRPLSRLVPESKDYSPLKVAMDHLCMAIVIVDTMAGRINELLF